MDSERFDHVLSETVARVNAILGSKAGEYAVGGDRLSNFKTSAVLQGNITPEEALRGKMAKHTVSIYDMINSGDPEQYTLAQWDEKIIDHINYLILLRALLAERSDRVAIQATRGE